MNHFIALFESREKVASMSLDCYTTLTGHEIPFCWTLRAIKRKPNNPDLR